MYRRNNQPCLPFFIKTSEIVMKRTFSACKLLPQICGRYKQSFIEVIQMRGRRRFRTLGFF